MIQEEVNQITKVNICRAISIGVYNHFRNLDITKEDVLKAIERGTQKALENIHKK